MPRLKFANQTVAASKKNTTTEDVLTKTVGVRFNNTLYAQPTTNGEFSVGNVKRCFKIQDS
jgi:hypothetical protein